MRENQREFTMYFREKEWGHLCRQAEKCGLTKSALIRNLVMSVNVKSRPPDDYKNLCREINAIGNNINQIARIANTERRISNDTIKMLLHNQDELIKIMRGVL